MSDEQDADLGPSGPGIGAILLPIVTAVASFGVGGLAAAMIVWLVKPAVIEEKIVPRDYTAEELAAACAPAVEAKQSEVEDIQTRVTGLVEDVNAKQAEVDRLNAEMKTKTEKGKEFMAAFEKAKRELADARAELIATRDELKATVEELKVTVDKLVVTEKKLEQQKGLTEYAKEDALTNKWFRFLNDAQLEICERGNRKQMGKCRDTVTRLLKTDPTRDKFAHCVRSGQATPTVREIKKRTDPLPPYASFIAEDERIVKGWFLLLCDPTLPEKAGGFLDEEHLPTTAPAAVGSADEGLGEIPD